MRIERPPTEKKKKYDKKNQMSSGRTKFYQKKGKVAGETIASKSHEEVMMATERKEEKKMSRKLDEGGKNQIRKGVNNLQTKRSRGAQESETAHKEPDGKLHAQEEEP